MRSVALVTAVLAGFVGATLGAWVGWQTAGPLVDTPTATGIVAAAFPETRLGPSTRTDALYAYAPSGDAPWTAVGGGDGYRAGTVSISLPFGPASPASQTATDRAVDRLRDAGWSVRTFRSRSGYQAFSASRDDVALRLAVRDAGTFAVEVGRARPAWVWLLTAIGFLSVAALAFFLVRWLVAAARGRPTAGALMAALLGTAALLTLPAIAVGAIAAAYSAITGSDPWAPLWLGFTMVGLRPAAVLAAVLTLAAVLLGAVRRRRQPAVAAAVR